MAFHLESNAVPREQEARDREGRQIEQDGAKVMPKPDARGGGAIRRAAESSPAPDGRSTPPQP